MAETDSNLTASLTGVNPASPVIIRLLYITPAGFTQGTIITLPDGSKPIINQDNLLDDGVLLINDDGKALTATDLNGQSISLESDVTKNAGNTVRLKYILTAGGKTLAIAPSDTVKGTNPNSTDEEFATQITFTGL